MPGMQMHMVQLDIPVPVDPALVGDAQNGEEGGAEEDGDADENGAEGDEGDEGTEDGSGTRPQLTHSTSNTRGSTSTEHKPKGRKGRKKAMNAPAGTEFRQILVPVPVPIGSAPPDPAQYQQQYAQYAQLYAQFYSQYLHQQHQAQQQQGQAADVPQEGQQQQPNQDAGPSGPPMMGGRNDGFVQWVPKQPAEQSPKRDAKEVAVTSEELSAIARALVSFPNAAVQPVVQQQTASEQVEQQPPAPAQATGTEVAGAAASLQQAEEAATPEVEAPAVEGDDGMGTRNKRRRIQAPRGKA